MATQNAINVGDSTTAMTGVSAWGAGTTYFTDSTLGSFTIDRPGVGFVKGKPVAWAGAQTITGLTAGNCYYICVDSAGVIYKTTDDAVAYGGDYIPLFECLRDTTTGTNIQTTVREDHPYQVPYAVNHYLHDSIGPIIENHANGAQISINANIQKLDILVTDYLLDHGLTTTISTASAITVHKMYRDSNGKWAHDSTASDTFSGHWNNTSNGTVVQLTGNTGSKYCIYTIYVSKDNLNSSTPVYYATLGDAAYNTLTAAQTAISGGAVASSRATNELAQLELCRLGYAIYSYPSGGTGQGFVSLVIAKSTFQAASSTGSGTNQASLVNVTTTNFDGMLTSADTTVQAALETIDDYAKAPFASADHGTGVSSTTMLTNVVNTTQGAGALTMLSTNANSGTNAGYIKMYVGTTVVYVPYFTNIAP